MAPGQLAEDYRLKLTTANNRTFELEGALADQAHELEHLRVGTAGQGSGDRLEAANARVAALEETIADQAARLEATKSSLIDINKSTLHWELESLRKRNQELENSRSGEELRGQVHYLITQLEIRKAAETALREQLVKCGGEDIADAVYIKALESQIKHLRATQSASSITSHNLSERLGQSAKRLEKAEQALEDRDRYKDRLQTKLAKEMRRRQVEVAVTMSTSFR